MSSLLYYHLGLLEFHMCIFWNRFGTLRGSVNEKFSAHPYEEPAYEVLKLEDF